MARVGLTGEEPRYPFATRASQTLWDVDNDTVVVVTRSKMSRTLISKLEASSDGRRTDAGV